MTGLDGSTPGTTRARLDRPMLVSNLFSGGSFLLILAAFGAWPLALIGAVYVIAGSLFLAAVYARETLTRRQEALAWITPWLGAAAVWMLIMTPVTSGNTLSHVVSGLFSGVIIATPCYVAWQVVALAIRQFMAWRSRPSSQSHRTEDAPA